MNNVSVHLTGKSRCGQEDSSDSKYSTTNLRLSSDEAARHMDQWVEGEEIQTFGNKSFSSDESNKISLWVNLF